MNSSTLKTSDVDQIELLFGQGINSSKASVGGALACFIVISVSGVSEFLLTWFVALMLASGIRLALLMRKSKVPVADLADLQQRDKIHYWTGLSVAACWGSLTFMPTEYLPVHVQAATWVVPLLVATIAMPTYAVVLKHYRDFLLVLTGIGLCGILWQYGLDALAGIFMYTLLGPVVYVTGKRYQSFMREAYSAHQEANEALRELETANRHLTEQAATIHQEEEIARHVFHQLTLVSENTRAGVHTWNQAMGSLSGDLIQVAHGPQNQTYVFLGDFTGHGLPAALGAVPASTTFQAMVGKGLGVAEIARELNQKLNSLLPTGYFCCAAIVELSADRSHIEFWNGGLPPLIVNVGNSEEIIELPGTNLPLGVVNDEHFLDTCVSRDLKPGDEVYIYSDGLTEAENASGEMWGYKRFIEFLSRDDLPAPRLDSLKDHILDFTNLAPASDDISIIEIEAVPAVSRQDVA